MNWELKNFLNGIIIKDDYKDVMQKTLKEIDILDIYKILSSNIFIILFFVLLGFVTGYFIVNQQTDIRKFELAINIPEHDYVAKEKLNIINANIHKIANLDREKLFVKFLIAQNPTIPFVLPNIVKEKALTEIVTKDLMKILLEYSKDPDLYKKTNNLYNQQVEKDYTDIDQINSLKLRSIPTYLSKDEIINGKPQLSVRIFFSNKYSQYTVDNYSRIYLNNLLEYQKKIILDKIQNIINDYNIQRKMLYDFMVFTLQNLGDTKDIYGEPLDKDKLQGLFIKMYPTFNSRDVLFNDVEATGILSGDFDFFYQSSSLNKNYKLRYVSRLILQDNNSVLGFVFFGLIVGILFSFLRFYYINRKK